MTFTAPIWMVPVAITLAVYVAAEAWYKSRRSSSIIGDAIDGLAAGAVMVIGILLTWLVYFALRFWLG